ncbi:MAG TPA: YceH family protein [Terriglobales bacterium]|nr:YceH family protein [Terriglobales bacterium]
MPFRATNVLLTDNEARVLGCLVEKEITTPDYYPLSLNALINACNQKSNRDPVMTLNEDAVRQAVHSLNEKGLAGTASSAGDSRVAKYEHRMQEGFNFTRRETAIMCVLMLRGPQTPGELRGRSERMHRFEDLTDVQSTLQKLMTREEPLVKVLPRQPGTKEARYAHLLCGQKAEWDAPPPALEERAVTSADNERITQLEEEIATLRREMADLREEVERFRKQFE